MFQTYIYDKVSCPDYIKTLKDKKGPAKKGKVEAQVEYGTACLYGITNHGKKLFKKDLKLALKYAKKSSDASNTNGLVLYALMQIYGEGTSKDLEGAYEKLNRAIDADENNRDAKYLIAFLYFHENFEQVTRDKAVEYLINSGRYDKHIVKQSMGDLGIIYFEGQHVKRDCSYALGYLIYAAPTYPPANTALRDCTKLLTDNQYGLDINSRPKSIYEAAMLIKSNNHGEINKSADLLIKWSEEKEYPPAMYDYASRHIDTDYDYCVQRMILAASNLLLVAIDFCAGIKSIQREQLMKYIKQSIYFKSTKHLETAANLYREITTKSTFNPGIYFRYKKTNFLQYDKDLIEQLKLKAWKDGSEAEVFAYAVCLENGFNGLEKDVENSVYIYKSLHDKGYEPATRNYAHFQEFGEFTIQDLPSAIKKLEQYEDLEAKASVDIMKVMLSDHPEFPFPYNHHYKRAKSGAEDDPSETYTKIALMLIRNKEMIPNFKLAEKILGKAKGKSALGTAITAAIAGDARAGKPNAKKAEKLFLEAMSQSSEPEIKELYAEFLIFEDRDEEAAQLDTDTSEALYTTRQRRTTLASVSRFSTKSLTTSDQLTSGSDLYFKGYIQNKDIRLLERAASSGFPLAESEYAHYILKEKKKKEYKKALAYLQSSSENGVITSYVLLGYMYHKGIETKANFQEAIKNYTKAIEQLEYQGYAGYALAYCTGDGFDKDIIMAHRCITIANETETPFSPQYKIDTSMFLNKEYKSKFDDIKNETMSAGGGKGGKAFAEAVDLEFHKHQLQKAFVKYEKAVKLEPQNHKYKRNYAYFLMKGIGNSIKFPKAIEIYQELGNADDLYNMKICTHYKNNHYAPFYMSGQANELYIKLDKENGTKEDYITFANLILDGKKVHQQYEVARTYLQMGARRFRDPDMYYLMGQLAEKGLGDFYSDQDIVLMYQRASILNEEDKFMGSPKNAKGCFKLGSMLAKGRHIYKDLHQAAFFLYKAIQLELKDDELEKQYDNLLDELNTNKIVIDPYDDYLTDFYAREHFEIEDDDVPISDFSNPFQRWKTYDPELEGSTDVEHIFQRGYQYMKGVGVAIDYTKALENLGQAAMKGHAQAHVYFAILAMMCHLRHRLQIFAYNIHEAKKQGLSLAYVEEAKVALGLYEGKNIERDDIDDAKESLQPAIDAGDPYALYIQGRYLDDEKSLQLASEKGCAKASYYIGKRLIEEGKMEESYSIIEKAADLGHPKAMFILGYLNKLKNNKEMAEKWLLKGAQISGNSTIAVKYALEKIKGEGIDKDEAEAYKWLEFAHKMRNMDGTLHLAICQRDGIGCKADKKSASLLFKLGIKMNIPEFFSEASQCHADMKGIKNWFKEKKYGSKAKKITKKGIEAPQYPDRIVQPEFQVDPTSDYNPGYAFEQSREKKLTDIAKYKYYLNIATKLGYFQAVKETIYQLLAGLYFEVNETEAYRLTNSLLHSGWETAFKIAGDIYNAQEMNVSKDQTFAMYKAAAEHGSKSGKFKYGICLLNGIGCEKDWEAGITMIENSGCKYAYNYLNRMDYKSKIAKPNENVLTILEKVAEIKVSLEYRYKPLLPRDKKGVPLLTRDMLLELIKRDIRYGIVMLNKFLWDFEETDVINKWMNASIPAIKTIAESGSIFASYQYGLTLYKRNKLEECIKYLKFAADRENLYACHFLGRAFYHESIGLYAKAKYYMTQSALKLNDSDDQYDLVFMCEDDEAQKFLDMAVKNDAVKFSLKAGDLYRNGIKNGLNKNPKKAAQMYEKAKYHCGANDLFRIGYYFKEGDGVDKNISTASDCFQRGADKGDLDCCLQYLVIYEENKRGYFPEKYYEMLADSDHKASSYCCIVLGKHYMNIAGSNDVYNYNRAAYYFERSRDPEALEVARKIRAAVAEYEEAKRREEAIRRAQENNSSSTGGGGGLLLAAVGIGVLLTTGIPIF